MTYELRTIRGARVMSFDNETRARDEMKRYEKRIGIELKLYRIKIVEELVEDLKC